MTLHHRISFLSLRESGYLAEVVQHIVCIHPHKKCKKKNNFKAEKFFYILEIILI